MKGLELSEEYYKQIGRPAIARNLPEVLPFIAAGLAGDGSDCLGFDDSFSADHDYGPGFCIWLEKDAFLQYGERLQAVYDSLPGVFLGQNARNNDPNSGKRVGVFSIDDFLSAFIGTKLPEKASEWYLIPEDRLAAVTSGKVFEDVPGTVTLLRKHLSYYPENVRIDKIASTVHLIAQTGQYNYARSMERGDFMAADISLNEFFRNVIHLVHLLDRKYEPYYKWAWRSFTELKSSEGLTVPLSKLMELGCSKDAWTGTHGFGLNYKDEKVLLIESVCNRLLKLLQSQELTDRQDSFLDVHTGIIASHIKN